jgi:AcrR family transcriptional regulator
MGSITRKPRPRGTRSGAGAQARLLEASERLLASGTPFIELSVEQLCSEAGVARSSFYVHFRDKADLIARLTEALMDELSAAASAWWRPGAERHEVLAATRRLVGIYAEHGALFAALTETAAFDAELRAIQQASLDRHMRPLADLVEAGQSSGLVRDVPTTETVTALALMVEGSCFRMARGAGPAALDRLAEALTSIVWHALYRDDAGPATAAGAGKAA